MERCFKSRQNSDVTFKIVVSIHPVILIKNVAHPLQVFYKKID